MHKSWIHTVFGVRFRWKWAKGWGGGWAENVENASHPIQYYWVGAHTHSVRVCTGTLQSLLLLPLLYVCQYVSTRRLWQIDAQKILYSWTSERRTQPYRPNTHTYDTHHHTQSTTAEEHCLEMDGKKIYSTATNVRAHKNRRQTHNGKERERVRGCDFRSYTTVAANPCISSTLHNTMFCFNFHSKEKNKSKMS